MEHKSCLKEFVRYSFCSVWGMLGVSCYVLADTYFVSKGVGSNGLAALNLAIPVYNFVYGCGLMLGTGGATKYSICKGQGDTSRVNIIYSNTIYLAIVFSVIFIAIGVFLPENLAAFLGADADIFEMTVIYLRWILIFAPAFIVNDILLCFVRNDGAPRLSMIAMFIGSLSNIVLDYVFIFPLQMGIFGAVFATGLSPIISIILLAPHWIKKRNKFHLVRAWFYKDIVREVVSLGLPSLTAQVTYGIVMMVFNVLILGLEGNIGIAAYGVIANISIVIVGIYTGIAQGMQPLVSNSFGRDDEYSIRQVMRYAVITVLLVSVMMYFVTFLLAEPITGIFNSENNLHFQEIAVIGLKLYFISNLFVGFNTIVITFFTSVEKSIPAHILSVIRGLILIIPMVYILSKLWRMTGIWLAYPVTELLAALYGCYIYRTKFKSKKL